MPTSLERLGDVVRALREAKGLSQQELARALGTNRSVVAHLEQGLRLPAQPVLSRVCAQLGVPTSFMEALEAEPQAFSANAPPPAPRILAVSGLMGSGKSTLARGIARIMGYRYLPEDMPATRYLSDLSRDPGRWAFETQLAFLCHRSVEFWTALNDNYAVVLDRTLSEDVNIFAKCFRAEGYIDQRAYDTYLSLARYFLSELPPPDLVLHCQCSIATALRRVSERQRPDRLLHGEQHLSNIAGYYEEWLATYRDSTVYILDSNAIDWRDPAVLQTIAQEIYNIPGLPTPPAQFDLFAPVQVPAAEQHLLKPHFLKLPEGGWTERLPRRDIARVPLYPFAYLAAPFTGRAVTRRPSAAGTLFVESNAHGRILRGPYRTMLLGVEKVLSGLGLKTLLPHRDINSWGNVTRQSEEVTQLCTEHVARCDLFVAILGESHGSHYEFGLARGLGKPAIIVHCKELADSFVASGIAKSDTTTLVIACDRVGQIPGALQKQEVAAFVRRVALTGTLSPSANSNEGRDDAH